MGVFIASALHKLCCPTSFGLSCYFVKGRCETHVFVDGGVIEPVNTLVSRCDWSEAYVVRVASLRRAGEGY